MNGGPTGPALLDVNVLIALLDPLHIHHGLAHSWFSAHGRKPFATCPITLNGCVRVLSHPRYPSFTATPIDVAQRLQEDLCARPNHEFWPDDVVPFDPALFLAKHIGRPAIITDVYLLALAVRHSGHLVTFDRSIPWLAILGATRAHVRVLSSGGSAR